MVGFQAEGTLGRRLLDGVESVRIYGEAYRVRCEVRSMAGMSAHADYRELLEFTGHLAATCKHVFVVHGEEHAALTYADRLRDAGFRGVEAPVHRQKFTIVK